MTNTRKLTHEILTNELGFVVKTNEHSGAITRYVNEINIKFFPYENMNVLHFKGKAWSCGTVEKFREIVEKINS